MAAKKAEKELPGYKCLYIGASEHDESQQIQIIDDLITRKVAGIAVAPCNAPAAAQAFRRAKAAGIPVITFDSDLLEKDKPLRRTYIGTNNYDLGFKLGELLREIKPSGGTIAVQSGGPAAANLNERMRGLRDAIKEQNWKDVAGSPMYCSDDFPLAARQMGEILSKYDKLDAFVAVGGWPQLAPEAYKSVIRQHFDRFSTRSLAVVVSDTLDVQLKILEEGLSHGQVGQRPFEMGYRALYALKDLSEGKAVSDPIYTGLDVCTPQTAKTCTGS